MLENEKLDDLDILGDAGKPEEHSHGGKRKVSAGDWALCSATPSSI